MKKAILCSILGVVSVLMSVTAHAAGGFVGADYVLFDTGITDHTGINIKGGYAFNDVISVEAKTLVSSSDEGYEGVNLDIESMSSLNLKVSLPLASGFKLFGSVGYGRIEAEATYQGYSYSESDTGEVYGFGLSYDVLEAYTVTAEYSKWSDEINIDGYSVGFNLNF